MIEIKEDVLDVLDKVEKAQKLMNQVDDIDAALRKLEILRIFLKRFGTLAELTSHLSFIERNIYMVKEYLTIQEAADFLHLSKSMIYKLTRERQLPIYKPNGKNVFIHRDSLNKWIQQNRVLSQEELDDMAEFRLAALRKEKR